MLWVRGADMNNSEAERRIAKLEQAVHDLYALLEIPSPYSVPDAPNVSGAALSAPSRSPQVVVSARVLAEAQAGRMIQAVKLQREETGMGLAEAKRAVEAAVRG